MASKKIDKSYISEIDKFLYALDNRFTNTASQEAEIDKHARIMRLRDKPYEQNLEFSTTEDWAEF